MEIGFATLHTPVVQLIQDGAHLHVRLRYVHITDGHAPVDTVDAFVSGQLVQNDFVGRQFVCLGQIQEGCEPSIEKVGHFPAREIGIGRTGILPCQQCSWYQPVGVQWVIGVGDVEHGGQYDAPAVVQRRRDKRSLKLGYQCVAAVPAQAEVPLQERHRGRLLGNDDFACSTQQVSVMGRCLFDGVHVLLGSDEMHEC